MKNHETKGYLFLTLICTGVLLPSIFAAPPTSSLTNQGRKFVTKSNLPKKVYMHKQPSLSSMEYQHVVQEQMNNKVADIGTPSDISGGGNSIGPGGGANIGPNNGGFPWNFFSNSVMQFIKMFLGVPNDMQGYGLTPASDKMDGGGASSDQGFSWGQVIGYGLKLLFAALGGNNSNNNSIEHDGIDKIGVEAGASPVQGLLRTLIGAMVGGNEEGGADNMAKQTGELINLAIALMNALKTSFSQRAMRARSLGQKDKLTDLTLAAIDMGKAYAKTFNSSEDQCKQLKICEGARECLQDLGQPNAAGLCHLTAYAAANLMYYSQSSSKDIKPYMDAARKGRSVRQPDCKKLYVCNEVGV